MAKCICAACDKTFKSEAGFNAHRTGEFEIAIYKDGDTKRKNPIGHKKGVRRCMTTDEMIAAGMTTNERGWWITGESTRKSYPREDETEESGEEAAD